MLDDAVNLLNVNNLSIYDSVTGKKIKQLEDDLHRNIK